MKKIMRILILALSAFYLMAFVASALKGSSPAPGPLVRVLAVNYLKKPIT